MRQYSTLTPEQRGMMKYMAEDRAAEVHRTGSGRNVKKEQVVLRCGRYRTHEALLITVMCRKPPRLPVRLDIYYCVMDDGT